MQRYNDPFLSYNAKIGLFLQFLPIFGLLGHSMAVFKIKSPL